MRRWVLGFLAALSLAAGASAVVSSSADAYWLWITAYPGNTFAHAAINDMPASFAMSHNGDWWVAAGAHLPGGWDLYGNMAVAPNRACHVYGTPNQLGPIMQNASLYVAESLRGEMYGCY